MNAREPLTNDSVIKLLGGESFPAPPDGIVSAEIDPTTELLATDQCLARRSEYFIEGTQPPDSCEAHTGEHPELPSIPGFDSALITAQSVIHHI